MNKPLPQRRMPLRAARDTRPSATAYNLLACPWPSASTTLDRRPFALSWTTDVQSVATMELCLYPNRPATSTPPLAVGVGCGDRACERSQSIATDELRLSLNRSGAVGLPGMQ